MNLNFNPRTEKPNLNENSQEFQEVVASFANQVNDYHFSSASTSIPFWEGFKITAGEIRDSVKNSENPFAKSLGDYADAITQRCDSVIKTLYYVSGFDRAAYLTGDDQSQCEMALFDIKSKARDMQRMSDALEKEQ